MNGFKVPIKNVLFMYSYIWDVVNEKDYINLSSEDDFDSSNIFAELFLINIKKILKIGLLKTYANYNDALNVIKGKIDFPSTLNKYSLINGKIYCNYDELVEDNVYNQILKSIAIRLYKSSDITSQNKKRLKKIILYFNQVSLIELSKEVFVNLSFNKYNKYYFIIIKICELIFNTQMLNQFLGEYTFYDLFSSDEKMNSVFELFINKFYQHELPKKYRVKYQSVLNWNLYGGNKSLLPIMKLDTLITSSEETIIIDTKYYKKYFVENYFNHEKLRSEHIYQMISYMNNIETNNILRGILLYPLSFDEKPLNELYIGKVVSDNNVKDAFIQFKTIDLSKDWREIKKDLVNIINFDNNDIINAKYT